MAERVALVTGASTGIGEGIARCLAKHGVHVVLVARRKEALEKVKEDIEKDGGSATVCPADVTSFEQVRQVVDSVVSSLGAPHFLVNNAGTSRHQSFLASDPASWDEMIGLNIRGYLNVLRLAVPHMVTAGRGHVVNVSSSLERTALPTMMVYTGTKTFWSGAAECLRKELKGTGVKVTNVLPGATYTTGLVASLQGQPDSLSEWLLGQKDKLLTPGDIGEVVWELVSKPERCYINEVLVTDRVTVD